VSRTAKILVLLGAIVVVLVTLASATYLLLEGKPAGQAKGTDQEVGLQPPQSTYDLPQAIDRTVSPTPTPSPTRMAPQATATRIKRSTPPPPTATLIETSTSPPASPTIPAPPSATPPATFEVQAGSGQKYGIHLLLDDGRQHWLPDVWPQHLHAARQIVGQGGYVIQLIRLDDLDVDRWQFFLDLCAQEQLVPIIRLATPFDHDRKWWEAPPKDVSSQGYTEAARRYREFLAQLRWPTPQHYAIVHNEPNRGDEWSDQPNPAEYAQFLLDVGRALHTIGFTVLAPALDLYAPHSNGQPIAGYRYIDAETFLDEMAAAVPEAFDQIDIWASHAYPLDPFRFDPSRQEFRIDYANGAANPRHLEPPEGIFNRGVNSYRWELWKLEQIIGPRAASLPVMITESGWRHADSQDPVARDSVHAELSFETQSAYLDLAFRGNNGRYPGLPAVGWTPWNRDPQVLAVVLFALGGFPKDWGHTNWVTLDRQGSITGFYPISLP
jgi:hypothetical protein